MAIKTSKRSKVSVFRALDILRITNERIAQGEDIIHMEAGQPKDGAPLAALAAVKEAITENPRMGYTEAVGIPPLRARIAQWYRDEYNQEISPVQVIISIGASGAFLLSFLAVFDAGDKVALAAPGYPAYRNILRALDIQPVEIQATAQENYQPCLRSLEELWAREGGFDGLIIASPCNPAGTIIPEDQLEEICQWCESKNVRLISDELYQNIVYGEEKPQTSLKFTREQIVVNSFSKYFAMTGWRLGWIVAPKDLSPRIKALAENLFVSPPTPSQHLALEIFNHREVLDEYVARYAENLRILREELPKAGFDKLSNTQGAFYLYVDIAHLTNDSEQFCKDLLDSAKVSITPGVDFDEERGHQTARISFAGPTEDIKEACVRLKNWYQARSGQDNQLDK